MDKYLEDVAEKIVDTLLTIGGPPPNGFKGTRLQITRKLRDGTPVSLGERDRKSLIHLIEHELVEVGFDKLLSTAKPTAGSRNCPSSCNCDFRTKAVGDGCEVCNPVLAAELSGLQPGSNVARKPLGRICHVVSLDSNGVLVCDPGIWRGRITWKTFRKDWKILQPVEQQTTGDCDQ